MSSTSYKAAALSHDLADKLKSRLSGALALVESVDTDGNPLITIGPGGAGNANALIKTLPVSWPLAKDVLGLSALQYTPHVMQLGTEADPTAGAGADPLSAAQLMLIQGEMMQHGTRIEWYQSAAGTAPTASILGDATKLKASFEPEQFHAMVQDQ